ncbi:MAG: hypothetical protein KJZ70_07660 [Bryobacterales bacterium]|nr:hypothetical protein [Bryobacterales bacterium]
MSAVSTFTSFPTHKYMALPAHAVKRFRKWFAHSLAQLPSWSEHATAELPPTRSMDSCPTALPGLNQRLIEKTWLQSTRKLVCTDGRLRLSGPETLDVCATPRETARSVRYFARWLDYLAADGIGIEIRKLDGWRTCALVDGVAVPIRIRERMRRVPRGNWLNILLERWLGGSIPTTLVSSGRLELQLLRMGVAFASFPVEGEVTPAMMGTIARAIRDMAGRQVDYQQRMHETAVAEAARASRAARRKAKRAGAELPEPKAATRDVAVPGASMPNPGLQGVQVEALASLAALSALGSAQIRELVQAIEKLTENTRESAVQREREMSESVVCLAQAMAKPLPSPVVDREPGLVTAISSVEGKSGKKGLSSRARRSHRVA